MTEQEKQEVMARLQIIDRQVRSICTMVLSDRSDSEILAQLKAAGQGLVAVRRTLLWLITERMLRLAAGLNEPQRGECIQAIMNLQRKYGSGQ